LTLINSKHLVRHIPAGEIVAPWLLLGPFYEDVSHTVHSASLFESAESTLGANIVDEVVEQARTVLALRPREGQETVYRGEAGRWSLVRRPDKHLSWGKFLKPHHLVTAFLATVVTPDTPGSHSWRLQARTPIRILVAVNGTIVADRFAAPGEGSDRAYEYTLDTELGPGENLVTVALIRISRMARVGFRLEPTDGAIRARIVPPDGMSVDVRSRIEDQVASVRLARDVFYPDQDIGVTLGVGPGPETSTVVRLLAGDGQVTREVRAPAAGTVNVCQAQDVGEGTYRLECAWEAVDGRPVTSVQYEIHVASPVPAPQGTDRLDQRRQIALEHLSKMEQGGPIWRGHVWKEVARYTLGRYDEVNPRVIRDTCAFIKSPTTGSDFEIQGILRLMVWERQEQHLSAEINALMADAILSYKYWADEPGPSKFFGSENHRLMYHVAEWMAGQLFPLDEFTNSRQRGLYHATKGRMFITEWLRQRGRFGFDEWHSNAYFGADIPPLVNIYDFALYDDYKLKGMAGAVLDYLSFILAADTFHGVFGTTHGRSYGARIKYPDSESTAPICWLLYGTGSLTYLTGANAAVSLATSAYAPPRFFADIAHDREAVIEARERQGVLRGSARHANFVVYRTPDYQISGLQDHRKGEFESSAHPAQVTLGNKAVLFWSCPHTSDEGSGQRPDYWSGNTAQPRVIQVRNVMGLTFRLNRWAWMSHCFYEQERYDEVRFEGDWAFARVDRGYVGIYSQNGMSVGDSGQYAGRELICYAPENTWLVECGREADWGSFDAFVDALSAAHIEVNGDAITYASPSIGSFVTGWDVTPTVDGEPVQLRGYPMVDSPWAHADFGSGELTVHYGDETYEIWFNQ
jgi:hypothetical protein